MNTEAITTNAAFDEGQAVTLTDANGNEEAVVIGEQTGPLTYRVTEKPEPPKLNRAQRRQLQRYIAHKARAQMRHVLKVSHNARMAHIESLARPCPRCGLDMLGVLRESTVVRCQCKATMKRQG